MFPRCGLDQTEETKGLESNLIESMWRKFVQCHLLIDPFPLKGVSVYADLFS